MDNDAGYRRLADAIILQAANDYRDAIGRLKQNPEDREAQKTVDECEKFFRSEWCYLLSGLDNSYLLNMLTESTKS